MEDNMDCGICNKRLSKKGHLKRHIINVHGTSPTKYLPGDLNEESSRMKFESFEDFLQWKERLESETQSLYVKQRGNIKQANGTVLIYYNCNRSGTYIPQGKNIRKLKKQKSAKVGYCPSRINIKIKGGKVFAEHFMKHEKHEKELQHLRLSKLKRAAIARKLLKGVPDSRILDDIRGSTTNSEVTDRCVMFNKQDIRNIKRDFNINRQRRDVESLSVKLWVEEMEERGIDNPVIYFKERGVDDPFGKLHSEDFVLIIMTSFQKEMCIKFSEDKICIDGSSNGLSRYDSQLFSLLVVDKYGNGCPVAFCFSNINNLVLFEVYFTCIAAHVGTINTKVFMSDDAPDIYSAWSRSYR